MRVLTSVLLAGAAVCAVAAALPATAQTNQVDTNQVDTNQVHTNQVHTMIVALPDGGVERIAYVGDVAPRVMVAPAAQGLMPVAMLPGFDWQPFAAMERISAMMDAQAEAMLRQASAMQAFPAGAFPAGAFPAGSGAASFVSFASDGVCSRTVAVTYGADGKAHTVSHDAGQCGAGGHAGAPAAVEAPAPAPAYGLPASGLPASGLIEAKADGAAAPVRQVAWRTN